MTLIPLRTFLAGMAALLFLASNSAGASLAGNTTCESFSRAKRTLLREVYSGHSQTFYCGSTFNERGEVSHTSGYLPKKEGVRAYRMEWDHIVPAQAFGQSFPEWRHGDPACVDGKGRSFKGRHCAEKVSRDYRLMQADMHNLVPAIGEVNALRSNSAFAMIPGEEREFGACDMEIAGRKVEPPPEVRGDIARTYFYMDAAYPGRGVIARGSRKLFQAWNAEDPVDPRECQRSRKVEELQGNGNPFVREACLAEGLW